MKPIICVRSKKAPGSWPKCGPDCYVAIQWVPAGVEPLRNLNRRNASLRGIRIEIIGEGYSRNVGPRSRYGQALAKAQAIVEREKRRIVLVEQDGKTYLSSAS